MTQAMMIVQSPSSSSEQDAVLGFGWMAVIFATLVIGVIALLVCFRRIQRKLDKPITDSTDPTVW